MAFITYIFLYSLLKLKSLTNKMLENSHGKVKSSPIGQNIMCLNLFVYITAIVFLAVEFSLAEILSKKNKENFSDSTECKMTLA